MDTCDHCPLAGRPETCPRWPSNHTTFCNWVDPGHPNFKADGADVLIRMARREPVPPSVISPRGETPGPTPGTIPLAGDLVAALTARIGADRAAEWVASKLGKPCGCAARREKLNRLDRKLRKHFGLSGQ